MGYLVGYDSTNIFRIYIPNQKVIRTRDVKFNEQFLYDDSQPGLANVLQVRTNQMLEIINIRQIQNLQDELESSSDESDETLDEIRVDTEERRLVESGGNQEESDIESSEQPDSHLSKDDPTPTPDKTPEPNSPEPPLSSNTSAKKKPHYVMVPTDEAEPKKKIGGDVGEQNVVKGKRLKGRSKAYARRQRPEPSSSKISLQCRAHISQEAASQSTPTAAQELEGVDRGAASCEM